MKSYPCNVRLEDIIDQYEQHLEEDDLIIRLQDGTCRIQKDHEDVNYQVFIDEYDIWLPLDIQSFLHNRNK